MKIALRTFAVTLLLSGAVLANHSRQVPNSGDTLALSHQTVNVGMPTPACPPDDPDGCGIGPNPKGK